MTGTYLKQMLSWFNIHEQSHACDCKKKAALMDSMGPHWCRANINTIVTWLETAAKKRGIPFDPLLARVAVYTAIWRAEHTKEQ